MSLVIGGGSGHYPSYNGVVGTGFADGAVLGDLFASPSAEQVYRICRAANGGAGIVLGFGNYAGDRLNFKVAADRLIAEGIDTRIVYVTDDIASASPEEARQTPRHRRHLHRLQDRRRRRRGRRRPRRGRAGDGRGQRGDVLLRRRLRRLHDARARRSRCSTVERGQMDFGLGIHGEPGITLRRPGCPRRSSPPRSSRRCWPNVRTAPTAGPRCWSTGSAPPSTRSCSPLFGDDRAAARATPGCTIGRPRGRRAGHQPRHGGLLAVGDLARRRARALLDRAGRHPGLPAR